MQLAKERSNLVIIGLFVIAIFLLATTAFLAWNYYTTQTALANSMSEASALKAANAKLSDRLGILESQNRDLAASVNSLNSTLSSTQKDLEITKSMLNLTSGKLVSTQNQLDESKNALDSQKQSISQLNDSLYTMRADLDNSFSWFRSNSVLTKGVYKSIDMFMLRVSQDCVEKNNAGGRQEYNLACAYDRMQNTDVSIMYKNDIDAGSVDHLQSLLETAKRWGGDCEDIALFSKATINYLKNIYPDATVLSWGKGTGNFRIYPLASKSNPEDGYSYFSDSKSVPLGKLSEIYPYVVCYIEGSNGHCTVALSKNKITSSSQIGLLDGAYVYEPTWGGYIGKVGTDFAICSTTLSQCEESNHYIWIVITDNDIFKYGVNGWAGFSDIAAQVDAVQARLGQN